MGRCRHEWRWLHHAAAFRGMPCEFWACDRCGKTWELFEGINPPGTIVVAAPSLSDGEREK